MPGQLPESFEHITIGKIVNVDYATGSCDLSTHDVVSGERRTIPYPMPYAGKGWGVLVGPEEGSLVAIGYDDQNRPWVLSYRPNSVYFNDNIQGLANIGVNDFPYRKPNAGEVILQSKANSAIELNKKGDIRLETVNDTYIEINKDLETIIKQSVNELSVTEAGTFIAGLVKRDIREQTDKDLDPLFGNTFGIDVAEMLFSDTIGKDPEYKQQDTNLPKGLYDPEFVESAISKNPALTEAHFSIEEYADGNVGLDQTNLTDAQEAIGKLEINRLMEIQLGTVVNRFGKILRFDYGFGQGGQGHGKIFKDSKDFFFNKNNTLKSSKESNNYEKFVSKLAKINTAIMLKLLLHTKGADFNGDLETDKFRGALWSLLVDKEGLTKVEIPAATNLGDEKGEPGRAGKSLLANLNGSFTLGLGKEKSEDTSINAVLNSSVAHSTKGRKDRSLTVDAEGNIELAVGADKEKNQSIMLAADGSIEAKIGKDTDNQQSVILTTDGSVVINIGGKDKNNNNLLIKDADGNTIQISSSEITIKHTNVKIIGGNLTVDGSVAPNKGPFCAVPNCIFTGVPHTGNKVTGT